MRYLITGGSGSFGHAFIAAVLARPETERVRTLSRNEHRNAELKATFPDARLDVWTGDVRDLPRVMRACRAGHDVLVHAAAMKRIEACEADPIEAKKTNIDGACNIVEAAIDCGIPKVLALSTDKAPAPFTLYGATKLTAERIVIQANALAGAGPTRLACVRWGNIIGSNGSVLRRWYEERKTGTLTVTDERMTRFWLRLEDAVRFTLSCLEDMRGGEVFVPKVPAAPLIDVARALAPDCKLKCIGMRANEKLHEVLISEDEARYTLDQGDRYVILPACHPWTADLGIKGTPVPEGFRYGSDTATARVEYAE